MAMMTTTTAATTATGRMIRFYGCEEEFRAFCLGLKDVPCPHCGLRGALIRHGHLYGYSEELGSEGRVLRGHRVYCSRRGKRRKGCGRTVSVLARRHLPGFVVTAMALWQLVINVVARGMSKAAALRDLGITHTASAAYRLIGRVRQAQPHIRTLLTRHTPAPETPSAARDPMAATVAHLRKAFPDSACPIWEFQQQFQAAFL